MKYSLPLYLVIILWPFGACAQGTERFWIFGRNNGLDFNTSPPSFFQSNLEAVEGCAAISDAAGNLMFYSNGNDVWDASGNVMPNGSGILGNGPSFFGLTGSSAQGVVIVPSIENAGRFYLFTLDATEDITPFYPGYLRYSIIDMSLNAGLGDVVATAKNIVLDSALTELMTVTKGNGCYYWLVTHMVNNASYKAYRIDGTGIHPPVVSSGAWIGTTGGGEMKISPDGTKLALGTFGLPDGFEIAAFNTGTGTVSNAAFIDTTPAFGYPRYGICFSPDNSKLYVGAVYSNLSQYDLAAFPNAAAVLASKTVINSSQFFYGMRNGPDGKIYVAMNEASVLGVIHNPNNAGTSCNFSVNGMTQPVWAAFPTPAPTYGYGFGTSIVAAFNKDTVINASKDTIICAAEKPVYIKVPDQSFDRYHWDDGSTDTFREVLSAGTYWVHSFRGCEVYIDTIKVKIVGAATLLGPDTFICPHGSLLLEPDTDAAGLEWQDGSHGASFLVTESGTYWVKALIDGCPVSDTIKIEVPDGYLSILNPDTAVCTGTSLQLLAETDMPGDIVWNTGETGSSITVSHPYMYTARVVNICGIFSDSVAVKMEDCSCIAFVPNSFTPNGDQVNDVFKTEVHCAAQDFSLSIFNRFGERVFHTVKQDMTWDGSFNGKLCDMGTYFYYLQIKPATGQKIVKKGDVQLIR